MRTMKLFALCDGWMVCLNEVKRKYCHKVETEIRIASEFRFILTFFSMLKIAETNLLTWIKIQIVIIIIGYYFNVEMDYKNMLTISHSIPFPFPFHLKMHIRSIDLSIKIIIVNISNLPGSVSKPWGGCCDNGPGVLPLPGDRTSSFIAPTYDKDELGGR